MRPLSVPKIRFYNNCAFAQDDNMVDTLATNRSDQSFAKPFCCMSSERFGQLAWQFKRVSGSSGLKVQAAIALLLCFYFAPPPAWHARAPASWKGHGVKTGVYGVKTGV